MVVSSVETLVVIIVIFGIVGAVRGYSREIWTLVGVLLTAVLLLFGGVTFLQQLPLRLAGAVLVLAGNQNGSNNMMAHPLGAPWTNIMLWIVVLSLLALSYLAGQRFGSDKPESVGGHFGGFVMGAISGLVIAVFIFQNGLAPLNVQFPDGPTTRSNLVPLIMFGFVIIGLALLISRPQKAATKS